MKYQIINNFFRIALLFIGLLLYFFNSNAQGYEIKITIPALKDSTIILGHHFVKPNSLFADDTIKLNKKGIGIFKGRTALTGGMYIVLLPSKKYFDILLGDDQIFSIEADTTDFLKTVRFDGSPDNKLFYEYQNFIVNKTDTVNKLIEKKKKTLNDQEKDSITKTLNSINQDVMAYIKKLKNDNPKLFFTVWLKSFQEIEVPEPPKNTEGKIIDSAFQYHYYHKHYFDNFDYADVRLLRTPFFEQKIKNYVDKVIPPIPDSVINEVDMLIEKVCNNEEVFRYMLVTLTNYYGSSQVMVHDAVFVHIAEKWYLPYATWSDQTSKEKLKKEVDKIKPNIIGNIAPNLKLIEIPTDHFLLAKNDTAAKSNPYVGSSFNTNDIKAKFLVMIFWEADCSHCREAIPSLYDSIYPIIKNKDVKVLAIHMIASIEGKRKWIDFVNEHQTYNWINAWSPYSYEYMDLYNISAKPTIYVIDENKKIIAKRIGPEKIEEVINFAIKNR